MTRHRGRDSLGDRFEWDDQVPGLGRRIQRGKETWVVQWRKDGRTIRRSLGDISTLTCEEARDIGRRMRCLQVPSAVAPSVAAFAESALQECAGRWKPRTLEAHVWCVRRIARSDLGAIPISQVRRQEVATWISDFQGDVSRTLAVLSFVMQHAELKGYRVSGSNPCKGLRRRRSTFKARYLSRFEYRSLFKALAEISDENHEEAALIRFLAYTGARLGEVIALTWDQLHPHRAVLRDSKTGPKTLWLPAQALELLQTLPRNAPNAPVFLPQLTRGTVRNRVRMVWQRVLALAYLGRLRIHDLRHSFASVGASLGIDLRVLAGLLGHADYSSTLCYAHLARAPVGRAAERVSRRLALALRPKEPLTPHLTVAKQSSQLLGKAMRLHVRDYRSKPADYRDFCRERGIDIAAFLSALQIDRQRRQVLSRARLAS